MIKPYLSNIINDHKNEWEIQLSTKTGFIPSEDSEHFEDSKYSNETRFLYTDSGNIVIMTGYGTDDIIDKLFESL